MGILGYRGSRMKRAFDIIVIFICMLVLLIPFLLLLILVRLNLGAPIFFTQTRLGRYGQPFHIVKFRTMTNERTSGDVLLPDALRLTPFGSFLRSSSLDELPEFWNVLVGDMSLVGPRPLLVEYLPLYSQEQMRRHEVLPGITGWAQVNGRNNLSWDEKFKLDVWYVDNQKLSLDLKILWLTMGKIVTREGINQQGGVTMSKFKGNKL